MQNNEERLGPKEAISFLKVNFTEPQGIIARIGRGLNVSTNEMHLIEEALNVVHETWENQQLISKQEALMLWNVFPRLEACLNSLVVTNEEIVQFVTRLEGLIDQLFTASVMSEEAAVAVLSQNVLGPSFLIEVRFGTINEGNLEELKDALKVLARAWKKKENISKLAAGAMISLRYLFASINDMYLDESQQRLQEIKQQIFDLVDQCLE